MRYLRFLMLSILVALAVVLLIQTGRSVKDSPPQRALAALESAKVTLLDETFRNLGSALDLYVSENNGYPADLRDLVPRYLTTESEIRDPWGGMLRIRPNGGTGCTVTSAGPDRAFGSADDIERSFQ